MVDDTPANVSLLYEILSGGGYEVRVALSGEIALQSIREAPPDLLLLDVVMPHTDGFAVCRELQRDGRTRDIPILFISALDAVTEKVRAFAAGGVDYITKPFQSEEVLARVGTHLERLHYQRRLQAGNEELNRRGELLSAIERLQAAFIGEVDPLDLYGAMLSALQSLSGSAEGFLAEVHHTPEGKPYLRIYAIFAPGRFFHANLGVGMAQRDLDNLCGAAVHAAEAVICNDPAGDPRWDGAVPAGGGPFLGMPIHCGERLVEVAGLSGREGGYDAELLAYLRPLVRTCGQLIDARQQREARSAAEQELNRLARVDGLTNIPNRRSLDEFLDNEWQRLVRNGGVLSLIMIDIDHFKRYNDHYGHISGDACLIELAWILR
ncbi:MAG: response regulator [Candidatus Sedimenticola endophacoides]